MVFKAFDKLANSKEGGGERTRKGERWEDWNQAQPKGEMI